MRKFISSPETKKKFFTDEKKNLLIEFCPRPLRKSTIKNWVKAFFSRHKMADVVTVTEELRSFFRFFEGYFVKSYCF